MGARRLFHGRHTVASQVAKIYNGILRVGRLADEVEMLAAHGIYKPPKAIGLTDEQVIASEAEGDTPDNHATALALSLTVSLGWVAGHRNENR